MIGKDNPQMFTHCVKKINKRLWIVCAETDEAIYTPPDFLRKYINSRTEMDHLAECLNKEWNNPITAIIEFETTIRNKIKRK